MKGGRNRKKRNRTILIGIAVVFLVGLLIGSYFMFFYSPYKFRGEEPIKIFWVNSYHSTNTWTNDFIRGFEDVFKKEGIVIEIKKFEMDTITYTSEEWKLEQGRKAKELIDEYKPDLIFATDDNAQEYLVSPYYLDSDIPIVFSGLNENPSDYGYDKSKNVAGVLERLHVEDSLILLKELYPYVKKIVILSEPTDRWEEVLDEVEDIQQSLDLEVIERYKTSSYEEFQEKILFYQDKADAFFLTPVASFLDSDGNDVTLEVVIQWIASNSKLPEITLWPGSIGLGLLGGVTISFYEQGKAGGELAKNILIDGKKPSSFEVKSTKNGRQIINLARARTLDLEIPSIILINSEVIEEFPWEVASQAYPDIFPAEISTGGKE